MIEEDKKYLQGRINSDDFDYTFIKYSDFKEIKDKKFHKLREQFLKSRKALAEYIKPDNV